MSNDAAIIENLKRASTATVSELLLQKGYRNTVMHGVVATVLKSGAKMVGRARTIRYIPLREDKPWSEQPQARMYAPIIDNFNENDVLVLDSGGEAGAGLIGDVLTTRVKVRGGAGIVVNGAVRDLVALRNVGLPVFSQAVHPAPHHRMVEPVDAGVPIGCGGVAVREGDWIFGDGEAVLVIPQHLVEEIAVAAAEYEMHDGYCRKLVEQGYPIDQAYPPNPALEAAYADYKNSGVLPLPYVSPVAG
jgi:5-oxopent-3-ene-1,2,5-tricarboxylate decarboxylase/2-hydroxyhepta-2,4-diene-1,7-dioate isomerase